MGNTTSGIKDIDAGQDIIIDKTTTPEIPIINFNRQ
jgi:hypothetical protein